MLYKGTRASWAANRAFPLAVLPGSSHDTRFISTEVTPKWTTPRPRTTHAQGNISYTSAELS